MFWGGVEESESEKREFTSNHVALAGVNLAGGINSPLQYEIAELADDCTIFRNGRNVATYEAGTKTDEQVVELMIGREYHNVFPPKPAQKLSTQPP